MEPTFSHKYIYMWNSSHRTSTERWQKTSDFQKGKKLLMYLGSAKEKKKREREKIEMQPAPLGGSCERRKVSTHWEVPSLGRSAGTEGELQSLGEERSNWFAEGKVERDLHRRSVPPSTPWPETLICWGRRGWVQRLGLRRSNLERTGAGCMETA